MIVSNILGDCEYDGGQRCVGSVSGCCQLHANRQFGAQETCLFVSDELCQIATRYGYYGRQYIR